MVYLYSLIIIKQCLERRNLHGNSNMFVEEDNVNNTLIDSVISSFSDIVVIN